MARTLQVIPFGPCLMLPNGKTTQPTQTLDLKAQRGSAV